MLPSPPTTRPPRSHARLLWRNAIVSVLTVAAEYVIYVLLVHAIGVYHVWAAGVAGALGILLNFMMSRAWVFADARGHWGPQLLRYGIATGLGIGAGMGLLYLLVDVLGLHYQLGWAISNLTIFGVWTYPSNRYFVFPGKKKAAPLAAAP